MNEDGTVRAFPWVAPFPSEDGVYAPVFVELHRDPASVVSLQERAEDTEHYWLRAQNPSPVWEITEWLTEEQVYERLMALRPRWKEIAAANGGCNVFAAAIANEVFGRDLLNHPVDYGVNDGVEPLPLEQLNAITPAVVHRDLTQVRVGDFIGHAREGVLGHWVVVMEVTEEGVYFLDEWVAEGHERYGVNMGFYPFAWLRGEIQWPGYTTGTLCPKFSILSFYTPLWEGHLENQEYSVTQYIHELNGWPWP